jgi:hypothetical protein
LELKAVTDPDVSTGLTHVMPVHAQPSSFDMANNFGSGETKTCGCNRINPTGGLHGLQDARGALGRKVERFDR